MSFLGLPSYRLPLARPAVDAAVDRARCVLMHAEGYLLARHRSRRAANRKRWGLPGGRLADAELPEEGLRREILEELGCRVPHLIHVGDWQHRNETHRIFGSELEQRVHTFDEDELCEIEWFTYMDVLGLAKADRLRTGFELPAIAEFRRRWNATRL